jgi:hypothetical protein
MPELNNFWVSQCILRLSEQSVAGCLAAASQVAQRYGAAPAVTSDWRNPVSAVLINTLLYLAGEPDVVRIVHPGAKPALKPKLARSDPDRFKDLSAPRVHVIGTAFARAVEHWEIEHANVLGDPTGKTIRPHMRRAHPHKYWTGEGRQIPRYRYLLPISVKGGVLVEEPSDPSEITVH